MWHVVFCSRTPRVELLTLPGSYACVWAVHADILCYHNASFIIGVGTENFLKSEALSRYQSKQPRIIMLIFARRIVPQ